MNTRCVETVRRVAPWSEASRSGLSFLELIGCLIAVVGGMWFGALYLGIDVDRLAYEAVRDSGFMGSIPDGMKPEPPEGHSDRLSEEELATTLQGELTALRQEISTLRELKSQSPVDTSSKGEFSAAKTLDYWKHLIEIVVDESALQTTAQSALTEANADNVFALRGRVCLFAAKAVEASSTPGVDPLALQFGSKLADWYVRSGNLYGRAAYLWSDQNAQESSAHLLELWETSERQLRNEAQLLNNKASGTQAVLSRTYNVEFPGFGR